MQMRCHPTNLEIRTHTHPTSSQAISGTPGGTPCHQDLALLGLRFLFPKAPPILISQQRLKLCSPSSGMPAASRVSSPSVHQDTGLGAGGWASCSPALAQTTECVSQEVQASVGFLQPPPDVSSS